MIWQNELRKVKYVGRTGEEYLIPFITDLLKQQNAELLEACEDAFSEINQLCYLLKDDLAKVTLDKLQTVIKKAKGE